MAVLGALTDVGVDLADMIPDAITGLGAIVTVVVGGYFGFLVVRKGLQWARKSFG